MWKIVIEERWNDVRVESLFNFVLVFVLVLRVLVVLKEDFRLVLKFFKWAKIRFGF